MQDVVKENDVNVKKMIGSFVNVLSIESIYDIALGNGFKRKINAIEKEYGIGDEADKRIRECTLNHIYDGRVAEVVESCKDYASVVRSVDVNDRNAVLSALQNSVCLAVQFGSKKNITAFLGTTNINIIDELYGKYTNDYVDLHNAYLGYIERMGNFRNATPPRLSSDMQKVYSCSLRVEDKGVRKVIRTMSSAEYTVNVASLVALFSLSVDNIYKFRSVLTDMLTELRESKETIPAGIDEVQFNESIFNMIKKSVDSGELLIHDEDELRAFMQANNLSDCIVEKNLESACIKMEKAFNRVKHARENGGKYLIQ